MSIRNWWRKLTAPRDRHSLAVYRTDVYQRALREHYRKLAATQAEEVDDG